MTRALCWGRWSASGLCRWSCRGRRRPRGFTQGGGGHQDREGQGQSLHRHGFGCRRHDRLQRRQHGRVHHRHGRHARGHQAAGIGAHDSRAGEVGDQQAHHARHQHPHARRSHRQQRVLRRHRRKRRPGEHQDQHGEDGRVQGRQGQVPAEQDLQGQADAGGGQGPDRPVPLRPRPHERRHLCRLQRGPHDAHGRHVRLEGAALHRSRQRRLGGGAPEDADPGPRRREERRHHDQRAHPRPTWNDLASSATSTPTSWPMRSAPSRPAKAWTRPRRSTRCRPDSRATSQREPRVRGPKPNLEIAYKELGGR